MNRMGRNDVGMAMVMVVLATVVILGVISVIMTRLVSTQRSSQAVVDRTHVDETLQGEVPRPHDLRSVEPLVPHGVRFEDE